MEPRARAGKNVGKMNFSHVELAQLLYAHGDVKNPLPETVRVLDEILTDFMQAIAFEATRAAHYSGRQKIKYEDFEFAFRRNPAFLGKVQEVFEKQREIKKAREILRDGEDEIMRDAADEEKRRDRAAAAATAAAADHHHQLQDGHGHGHQRGRPPRPDSLPLPPQRLRQQTPRADDEELGEADDDAEAEADALGRKR